MRRIKPRKGTLKAKGKRRRAALPARIHYQTEEPPHKLPTRRVEGVRRHAGSSVDHDREAIASAPKITPQSNNPAPLHHQDIPVRGPAASWQTTETVFMTLQALVLLPLRQFQRWQEVWFRLIGAR